MSRILVLILLVTTCVCLPAAAIGQQYTGDALPDGPSTSEPYPLLGAFNLSGWLPGSTVFTPLKLYVGYQGRTDGWKSDFTSVSPGVFFDRWHAAIRNSAVWLGAESGVVLSDNLEARLRGWYVVPTAAQAERESPFWRADSPWVSRSWWYADAVLVYHMSQWFSLIHGWRIDEDKAIIEFALPAPWVPDGRVDSDLSSTIPYVGVETRLRRMKVTALASPVLISSFRQDMFHGSSWEKGTSRFKKGCYFVDISAEYTGTVADNLNMGLFASAQWLHAAYDLTWTGGGVNAGFSESFEGSFFRSGWAVGGRMVLSFSLW